MNIYIQEIRETTSWEKILPKQQPLHKSIQNNKHVEIKSNQIKSNQTSVTWTNTQQAKHDEAEIFAKMNGTNSIIEKKKNREWENQVVESKEKQIWNRENVPEKTEPTKEAS